MESIDILAWPGHALCPEMNLKCIKSHFWSGLGPSISSHGSSTLTQWDETIFEGAFTYIFTRLLVYFHKCLNLEVFYELVCIENNNAPSEIMSPHCTRLHSGPFLMSACWVAVLSYHNGIKPFIKSDWKFWRRDFKYFHLFIWRFEISRNILEL